MGFARGLRGLPEQQQREVAAVNHRLGRRRAARDRYGGRQDIHGARDGVAHAARRDFPRPPSERRDAHAAFPGAAFTAAQRAGASAVGALDEPRTVVARENDERLLIEPQLAQRVEHAAHAPVQLFHPVAEATVGGLARERRARMDRRVNGGVRQVEEERTALLARMKPSTSASAVATAHRQMPAIPRITIRCIIFTVRPSLSEISKVACQYRIP